MNNKIRILLLDEGMNTGISGVSKVGGGQIARKRFFADSDNFQVTVLTSEYDIAQFWEGKASIIYEPRLRGYRPNRIQIARTKIRWLQLIKQGMRTATLLKKYLAATDAHVVFFNENKSRLTFILWRLLNPRLNIPLTAIQVDGEWQLGVFDTFMKFAFLLIFDKIICPSNSVRTKLGGIGRLFSKKILTAYPGVELPGESQFHNRLSKESKKEVIFGCIGTLRTAVKGQDIIIRAVNRLLKKNGHLPFKVLFFGDGPDMQQLKELIRSLNLSSYFIFKGFVKNPNDIYDKIECCIIASRTETASIVLIESLIRNIPVVSSNIDACVEILSPFYNKLIFENGSDENLASILEHVLKSNTLKDISDLLRKANKHKITKDYQVKRIYRFLSQ